MKIQLLLVMLLIPLISAVEVDFDCPTFIEVDEEFNCSLEVLDGEGVYDVKVEVLDGEKTVARIWKDNKWGSGYYYINEFIGEGEKKNVKLKIESSGDFDFLLKLRQGDSREFFEFEITVGEGVSEGEVDEVEILENLNVKAEEEIYIEVEKNKPLKVQKEGTIFLTEKVVSEVAQEETLVYESKGSKNMKYLPYAFSLFLILVLFILLQDKF